MIYSHPSILLKNHLSEVGEASKKVIESKNLDLTVIDKNEFKQLAYLTGIAHDFGKVTTFFQLRLKGRNIKQHTHHAPLSSLFAYILGQQLNPENKFLPIMAYLAVRYHHSNLQSPEHHFSTGVSVQKQFEDIKKNQLLEVKDIYEELLPDSFQFVAVFEQLGALIDEKVATERIHLYIHRTLIRSIYSFDEEQKLELFLCCNFLFSVLIDSDKKSAGNLDTDYFDGATEPVINMGAYLEHLQSKYPEKFDSTIPINNLRNTFFKQVTTNPKLGADQHLYTITAPTGIGKTFAVFSAANKLKEKLDKPARIIYSLPFTSIIDQNFDELKKILEWALQEDFQQTPTKYLLKHHYLSPMKIERDKADEEKGKIKDHTQYYDDRVLNESWDAGHIVTTFVQLLESIIGFKNRQLKKFHNIINAILILDEVQNIPADFHLLIGKLLKVLAHRFNTYIILMTATQPIIFKDENTQELANVNQFFRAKELNRVEVKCLNDLESLEVDAFRRHILENFDYESMLIVCNTKASAHQIFEKIRKDLAGEDNLSTYCLTTLQTPTDRLNQIEEIEAKLEKDEIVICVSTQLIEAGVDLSFPVVYRDLGPFDSIVQVAGRCNRHGKLKSKGKMYLLKLKDENERLPSNIYDQLLIQFTSQTLENKKQFESKNFLPFGQKYFGLFDITRVSKEFIRGLGKLNYSEQKRGEEKPVNEFKLIEKSEDQRDLIICTSPEVEQMVHQLEENREVFKDAEPYSKERKKLMGQALELRQKLANYTITLYKNQFEPYSDSAEIRERFDGKLLFVPYDFYEKEIIYNKKIGFITDPDTTTQSLSF